MASHKDKASPERTTRGGQRGANQLVVSLEDDRLGGSDNYKV